MIKSQLGTTEILDIISCDFLPGYIKILGFLPLFSYNLEEIKELIMVAFVVIGSDKLLKIWGELDCKIYVVWWHMYWTLADLQEETDFVP